MQTLTPPAQIRNILSFDFDGTLHHPAENPPVPREFFETIQAIRESHGAVWGINTGRSMAHMIEGFIESGFPFLPDWVVAREREIYFPNAYGRWVGHVEWNDRCEKEIQRLFRKSGKLLKRIRAGVEEHTGAQWIEMAGEPAGIISRTEEEMEWICQYLAPHAATIPELGWQRNSIYLRFGHRDFQKGSSLTEIANQYGIPLSGRFAIGDSHNDLEMLDAAHCALAACPANAVGAIREKILARGGFVATMPHGNGTVQALEYYFRSV
ncbi:MAG: HAD-IIB family hydrolase [Luteolibacter sp.]